MTTDTAIGRKMRVAPPTLPPNGRKGGAMLPWQQSPGTPSGDGAEE